MIKRDPNFASEWDKSHELERTRIGAFDIGCDTAEAANLVKSCEGEGNIHSLAPFILLKVCFLHSRLETLRSYNDKNIYTISIGNEGPRVSDFCYVLNVMADLIDPGPSLEENL